MSRILVVDDDDSLCYGLRRVLEPSFEVITAEASAQALKSLEQQMPDLILLDYRLGEESGLDLLARIKQQQPSLPVVMMTAFGSNETIMAAMELGADDYLVKPVDGDELESTIRRLLATSTVSDAELIPFPKQVPAANRVIGSSKPMRDILKLIPMIAGSDSSVIISGESGTGKELIARMIHQYSSRSQRPFVALNCAAIPEALLESELFGYVKGAFSGAFQNKAGKIERAHTGTLFLDEIGDIPLTTQPKLLRFLQEKTYERLGDNALRQADVRIVSASNRNIVKLIQEKRFRDDLFFRINVIRIDLPPLRERPEDLRDLLVYFARRFSAELEKDLRFAEQRVLDTLVQHSWPGNVREFQNVMKRAVIFARGNCLRPGDIQIDALPQESEPRPPWSLFDHFIQQFERDVLVQGVEQVERELIKGMLKREGGHLANTARHLGISRVTLNAKLRKYGIQTKP